MSVSTSGLTAAELDQLRELGVDATTGKLPEGWTVTVEHTECNCPSCSLECSPMAGEDAHTIRDGDGVVRGVVTVEWSSAGSSKRFTQGCGSA